MAGAREHSERYQIAIGEQLESIQTVSHRQRPKHFVLLRIYFLVIGHSQIHMTRDNTDYQHLFSASRLFIATGKL